MSTFVRPEISVAAIAAISIVLITISTLSALKIRIKKIIDPYVSLYNLSSLAVFICSLIVGLLFTLLAMYVAESQIQKNAHAYLHSDFFIVFAAGFCIAYFFISRAFSIGFISDLIAIFSIFGVSLLTTTDYCYIEGVNLHVAGGFNKKRDIGLTSEKIEKIVLFKKISGRPKFDHLPIDDVVLYLNDGSRWSSAFYAADIVERRKFNNSLLEAAQAIKIERVDEIHISKIN